MGKKRPNTIRTTISVPRELKGRMDKVKEDVNWSALACQAFQEKLAGIATRKEKREMKDVIERLRASKRKSGSEDFQEGYQAGREWAEKHAEAVELEQLGTLNDRWDWSFLGEDDTVFTVAEALFFEWQPERDGDRAASKVFWECAVGDDESAERNLCNAEFLKGFCEGALKVWETVESQL